MLGFQLPSSAPRLSLHNKLHQIELPAAQPADEGLGQKEYMPKLYHEYIAPFIVSDDWATVARGMR